MIAVEKVKLTRIVEKERKQSAEVRVKLTGEKENRLIVYIGKDKDGDLEIKKILKNDADYEIDWYDNDLHQAFHDITEQTTREFKNELLHEILKQIELKEEMMEKA